MMFVTRPEHDAWLFMFHSEKLTHIHTIFVFFPIDIIYLSRRKVVVDTLTDVKQFIPIIRPKKKAMYIIEARAGLVRRTLTKPGDQIDFEFGRKRPKRRPKKKIRHKLFKSRRKKV